MEKDEREELVEVMVWDWQTRALHWINALLIITLMILIFNYEIMEWLGAEEEAEESIKRLHAWVGHILAVTFILRVVWGFAGNEYARWLDMIPYNKERWNGILDNLRWYLSGLRGSPPPSVGHNPLASLFYIALFLVLTSQVFTGITLAGEEFGMIPGRFISSILGHEVVEGFEEIHEFGLWFMVFFLSAHLTGVIAHELKDRTGLFWSMVNGKKYLPRRCL